MRKDYRAHPVKIHQNTIKGKTGAKLDAQDQRDD